MTDKLIQSPTTSLTQTFIPYSYCTGNLRTTYC